MSPVAPIDENMELLRSMADDRCPILGTRQPEARAAGWAWEEINRLRGAQNQTGRYSVTLDDLVLLAAATREIDYQNCYIKGYLKGSLTGMQPNAEVTQTAAVMVDRLYTAIDRIAGPDAGEIYARAICSATVEQS